MQCRFYRRVMVRLLRESSCFLKRMSGVTVCAGECVTGL